jgi:hypothetical protein
MTLHDHDVVHRNLMHLPHAFESFITISRRLCVITVYSQVVGLRTQLTKFCVVSLWIPNLMYVIKCFGIYCGSEAK